MRDVILRADKVTLREFGRRDTDAVLEWVSDPDVVRYVPLGPFDRAEAGRYVRNIIAERRERPRRVFTLAIVNPTVAPEPIGAVALSIDSVEHRRGELGFMVRRSDWGCGFGAEAARRMIEFGHEDLGLHRIWAVCDPENVASARVLESVGMEFEGRLRGDMLLRGRRADSLLYAAVADEALRVDYL